MQLKVINKPFSVCKVGDYSLVDLTADYVFIGKTDEERSLVCETPLAPANRTDGGLSASKAYSTSRSSAFCRRFPRYWPRPASASSPSRPTTPTIS